MAVAASAAILILGLANIGYLLLVRYRPEQNLPKIGSRIRFLWILLGVYLLALVTTPSVLVWYIALLAYLALKEFLSMTPTRQADRHVLFWAYTGNTIQFFFIWMGWYEAFISFIPLYVLLFLPLMMVIYGETRGFLKALGTLNWGVLITVYSLGHLAYLLVLPSQVNPIAGGLGLFLFLTLIAQLNHIGQYLFGKLFDHPKLRLKVSKSRNWGSLIGTLILTPILSWLIAPQLTPFDDLVSLSIGLIIALGGFVGYITMSAVKSDLQLADRGTMTPGHGGVLNRIEMLIISAPIFFHLVSYLYWL